MDASAGDDAADGLGWPTALRSIAAAIERAEGPEDVATINVAAGTYAAPLVVPEGVSLVGGFPSGGGDLDPAANPTVLEGRAAGSVVTFPPGAGGTLVGFTIRGGSATDGPRGGGITIERCPAVVALCVIEHNEGCRGGGVHVDGRGLASVPRLIGVVVRSNVATCRSGTGLGGGVYVLLDAGAPTGLPVLQEVAVERNAVVAPDDGIVRAGGAHVEGAARLVATRIRENAGAGAVLAAGGSFVFEPAIELFDVELADNAGPGAVTACPGRYAFTNVTFAGNGGGSLRDARLPVPEESMEVDVRRSILWGEGAEPVASSRCPGARVTVEDSIVEGGFPGGRDVLDADPLFVAGPHGAHYLSQTDAGDPADSPALDAGDPDAAAAGLDTRTTRADSLTDTGPVDLGVHHAPVPGGAGVPEMDVLRSPDPRALAVIDTVARLPWSDLPGTLADPALPRLYYRVAAGTRPIRLRKDLAAESVVITY